MRCRLFVVSAIFFAISGTASVCTADDPSTLPSERVDDDSQYAYSDVDAFANGAFPVFLTPVDDYDAVFAASSMSHGSAADNNHDGFIENESISTSLVQSENLVSPGNADFVPQINAAASMDVSLWGVSLGFSEGHAEAYGTFEVLSNPDLPGTTDGQLMSTIILVAIGDSTTTDNTISASSSGSHVTASWTGAGWNLNGLLKNRTGTDISVSDYSAPGINEIYVGTEYVEVGDSIDLTGYIDCLISKSLSTQNDPDMALLSLDVSVHSSYRIVDIP